MLKKLIAKHKDEIMDNNNIELKQVVKPKRRSTITGNVMDFTNSTNYDEE